MSRPIALVDLKPEQTIDIHRIKKYLDVLHIVEQEDVGAVDSWDALSDDEWLALGLFPDASKLWVDYLKEYVEWRSKKPIVSKFKPGIQFPKRWFENPFYLGPQGFRKLFLFPFLSDEKNFLKAYKSRGSFSWPSLSSTDLAVEARLIGAIIKHYCAEDPKDSHANESAPGKSPPGKNHNLFIDQMTPDYLASFLLEAHKRNFLPVKALTSDNKARIMVMGLDTTRGPQLPTRPPFSALICVHAKHTKIAVTVDMNNLQIACPPDPIVLLDCVYYAAQELDKSVNTR